MREIKFRLWNKKCYCLSFLNEFDNETLFLSGNKIYEIYAGQSYDGSYLDIEDISDDYILMQYTCLRDKNDKEIYEGDIVTLSYNGDCRLKIYTRTIIFECGMFICASESGSGASLYSRVTLVTPPVFEVIGNIYENPELLDKE